MKTFILYHTNDFYEFLRRIFKTSPAQCIINVFFTWKFMIVVEGKLSFLSCCSRKAFVPPFVRWWKSGDDDKRWEIFPARDEKSFPFLLAALEFQQKMIFYQLQIHSRKPSDSISCFHVSSSACVAKAFQWSILSASLLEAFLIIQ